MDILKNVLIALFLNQALLHSQNVIYGPQGQVLGVGPKTNDSNDREPVYGPTGYVIGTKPKSPNNQAQQVIYGSQGQVQERPIPKGRDVTIQGQRLSGAYIEEITDTRITVRHARGTTVFHPKVVPKTLFEDHSEIQRQKAEYDDKLMVKAKLIQVMPQGAITQTSFVKWVTMERRVQVPGTMLDTKPRYKTENYETEELIPWEGLVFIYGIPPNYVDGEVWSGEVFPAGSYSYTTVTGASKTVRALATSADLAMRILANGSE